MTASAAQLTKILFVPLLITFHHFHIWKEANCSLHKNNDELSCAMCRRWYKIYLCNLLIISWIMLLKSRERHRRIKNSSLFSCLVLAIKLNDKEANLKCNILSLITFDSCFNHNSLCLLLRFFICHINNGSFLISGVQQKKKQQQHSSLDIIKQQMKFDTKQIQISSGATCLLHQTEMHNIFCESIDEKCVWI